MGYERASKSTWGLVTCSESDLLFSWCHIRHLDCFWKLLSKGRTSPPELHHHFVRQQFFLIHRWVCSLCCTGILSPCRGGRYWWRGCLWPRPIIWRLSSYLGNFTRWYSLGPVVVLQPFPSWNWQRVCLDRCRNYRHMRLCSRIQIQQDADSFRLVRT